MIKFIKNFIGLSLFWIDLLVIGAHAAVGVFLLYTSSYLFKMSKAYYDLLVGVPEDWANTSYVFGWMYSIVTNTATLTNAGWAWLYLCAAGFAVTIGALATHEAIIRFRVRLG